MSEFTYEVPDEKQFMSTVLLVLKKKSTKLYQMLRSATCSINATSDFSRDRWNAMYTTVYFKVPPSEFEDIDLTRQDRQLLAEICDQVMPTEAGLDVMDVDVSPQLGNPATQSLQQEIEALSGDLDSHQADFNLPTDILSEGRQMAEVYFFLYAVENYLRLFIERVGQKAFGAKYFDSLQISTSVSRSIATRKDAEAKNQWMSVRGQSPLFYLDFKDLGTVILNNWELFKGYFPDQAWISSKIDDLGSCRNLVAHNSRLGEHEKDVIRVTFKTIVRQLNPYMK